MKAIRHRGRHEREAIAGAAMSKEQVLAIFPHDEGLLRALRPHPHVLAIIEYEMDRLLAVYSNGDPSDRETRAAYSALRQLEGYMDDVEPYTEGGADESL